MKGVDQMGLYFEKEDKEILNEAVTPLQVVEYLGLPGQKIGPNISILCPASDHNDHSYGNCVVYDQGRKCRCFACQRSFTPLSILIEAGHYSFYEAMCILASMAHMDFPKIQMAKGVLPGRDEKKRTFRDASGDYIWYESVTNPWVELARDDPETLNWMIQGKCEEKMTQLGLIRKNLDDSEQNEIGAFIEAVLQNCHLTNEKPRMTEYVIELEKQLLKIYHRFGGSLSGKEMGATFLKNYTSAL